jgi:hypothetical protein
MDIERILLVNTADTYFSLIVDLFKTITNANMTIEIYCSKLISIVDMH